RIACAFNMSSFEQVLGAESERGFACECLTLIMCGNWQVGLFVRERASCIPKERLNANHDACASIRGVRCVPSLIWRNAFGCAGSHVRNDRDVLALSPRCLAERGAGRVHAL